MVGIALGGPLAGCSTVIFSDNGTTERSAAIERAALISAAAEVSAVKWPAVREASWSARLVGLGGGDGGVSKNEAAAAYLASLEAGPGRERAILADAEDQLLAADRLANAAHAAVEAVRPVMADVGAVEAAIGDLREARDIYLATLKLVRDETAAPVADAHALKAEFNAAIEALGEAADRLADRVAHDRTETYARPERRGLAGPL
ncbi:MAG: hypothetical protein AB7P23_06380 [Amphiplicatus sp.]